MIIGATNLFQCREAAIKGCDALPEGSLYSATILSSTTIIVTRDIHVDFLLVGGGGAGGQSSPGGGGAGGVIIGSSYLLTAGTYPIVIGQGGAGVLGLNDNDPAGNPGQDSTFADMIAAGGGGGGACWHAATPGGCGGGGSYTGQVQFSYGGASIQQSYSGVTSYGFPGEDGQVGSFGKGGAGAGGSSSSINGGLGIQWYGSWYAGGGGATSGGGTGLGGSSIGGNGCTNNNGGGYPGVAHTGSGGGGGMSTSTASGAGGSGIFIIKYLATE